MFWKWRIISVVLVISLLSSFPFRAYSQDIELLRQRVRELETENSKLRKAAELQSGELLELRRKIKEMEATHPDQADSDPSRILLEARTWNYSAGLMMFYIFDAGDAVNRRLGGFGTGGFMAGGAFSAGKDRDRFGITIYQGEYDVDSRNAALPDVSSINRKTSDRLDIDVAWTRMVVRNDRFGLGYLWGAKYLRSEKTIESEQTSGDLHDEKRFNGVNEWEMVNFGLFLSGKVFPEYPLYAFISGSISIGMVQGMVPDVEDGAWDDGMIESTYRTDSHMAWALNGSLGLQQALTAHSMLRVGYRGHALNSTDGFSPINQASTFYDGHQSVFVALDILF